MSSGADCLVAFAAVGQAQRVRARLIASGSFADIVRTPARLGLKGCGFSLRAPLQRLTDIEKAAVETGISIRGRFAARDGTYEAL